MGIIFLILDMNLLWKGINNWYEIIINYENEKYILFINNSKNMIKIFSNKYSDIK